MGDERLQRETNPRGGDQGSLQAETAAGETPVAGGSHCKGSIEANFAKYLCYYSSQGIFE